MKGFTLIEALVAVLIFGMLAAAGVAVMRSTVDSQASVKARTEEIAAFQRLRATLKADLGQAAVRRTRGLEGLPPRGGFTGGQAGAGGPLLALVRRGWENPEGEARPSLQYVEYRLAEGRLERRVRAALDGAPLRDPQVLFEGVEASEIAFYAGRQWRTVWDAEGLPEVVRLKMRFKGLGEITQLFLTPGASL